MRGINAKIRFKKITKKLLYSKKNTKKYTTTQPRNINLSSCYCNVRMHVSLNAIKHVLITVAILLIVQPAYSVTWDAVQTLQQKLVPTDILQVCYYI